MGNGLMLHRGAPPEPVYGMSQGHHGTACPPDHWPDPVCVVERTNEEESAKLVAHQRFLRPPSVDYLHHRSVVAVSTNGAPSPEGAPHDARHQNAKQLIWSDGRGRYGKTLPCHLKPHAIPIGSAPPRSRRIRVKVDIRLQCPALAQNGNAVPTMTEHRPPLNIRLTLSVWPYMEMLLEVARLH